MTELDNRIGEYAADIIPVADLLLDDTANLNLEQQQFVASIKRVAVDMVDFYQQYVSGTCELDTPSYVYNLRAPTSLIGAYCMMLGLTDETGPLSESQLHLVSQIKASAQLIRDVLNAWGQAEAEKWRSNGTG